MPATSDRDPLATIARSDDQIKDTRPRHRHIRIVKWGQDKSKSGIRDRVSCDHDAQIVLFFFYFYFFREIMIVFIGDDSRQRRREEEIRLFWSGVASGFGVSFVGVRAGGLALGFVLPYRRIRK